MGQQPTSSNDWSIPKVIYEIPDSVRYVKQYDAGLLNGRVDLLLEQYDTTGLKLDFSEIYFLEGAGSVNQKLHSISNTAFRAEAPSLVYSNNDVHFFWGERRLDPEFNEWDRPRAPLSSYSTSLFSVSFLENSTPVEIYKSDLWLSGLGNVSPPVHSVFDNNTIYSVAQIDSNRSDNDPGATTIGFFKNNLTTNENFISKLELGIAPTIAIRNEQIWVSYLGSDAINGGRNNTYVMQSLDSGSTWSDPLMLSQSDDFQVEVSINKTIDNSLHILHSTSTDNLPAPNQLWHTLGEDFGTTWREKTLIYETKYENLDETLFIISHKIATDSYGQVHIVMFIIGVDSSRFGIYTSWNPYTQTWSSPQKISIDIENALFIDLEVSEDNILHLFWDDRVKRTVQYATKEITAPKLPDIFKSNKELQLHNVYPNPSNTRVTIPFTLKNESDVSVSIYSLDGSNITKTVLGNKQAGFHQERIDVSHLSSGVYIFDIQTSQSNSLSGKFTVIRS